MREDRYRVPVADHRLREGVDHAGSGQPRANLGVLGDELRVIVVNESIVLDRPINAQSERGQQQAKHPFTTHPRILSGKRPAETSSEVDRRIRRIRGLGRGLKSTLYRSA